MHNFIQYLIISCLLTLLSFVSFAQENVEKITSPEEEPFYSQIIQCHGDGFYLKTGKQKEGSKRKFKWTIKKYTPELEVKKETKFIAKNTLGVRDQYLIKSYKSDDLYYLKKEYVGTLKKSNEYSLTHFDENLKRQNKTKYKLDPERFGHLGDHFTNNKSLILIGYEEERIDIDHDDPDFSNKLFLNIINKKEMKIPDPVPIEFPDIKNPDGRSFWNRIYHNNNEIVFSSQSSAHDGNHLSYHIAKVNYQGKLKNNFKIKVKLPDNKKIYPSINTGKDVYNWGALSYVSEKGFPQLKTDKISGHYQGFPQLKTDKISGHYDKAFSQIYYDESVSCYFVFGWYSNKQYKGWGKNYHGIFINKYKDNGKKIYSKYYPVIKKYDMDNKYTKVGNLKKNLMHLFDRNDHFLFKLAHTKSLYNQGRDAHIIKIGKKSGDILDHKKYEMPDGLNKFMHNNIYCPWYIEPGFIDALKKKDINRSDDINFIIGNASNYLFFTKPESYMEIYQFKKN